MKLSALQPHTIQALYNKLQEEGLSPKTIKNLHGVLHKALKQAVMLGYASGKTPKLPSSSPRMGVLACS